MGNIISLISLGCYAWLVELQESMEIWGGLKLSTEELMLLNCGVGENSWESLGLQGDPTSQFWRRSTLGFLWKEWCWSWNSSTLATSWEELTHWKRPWCWEGLEQEEKGTTEDGIAAWHHWLDGRESEWTLGVGDGQGGLACCDLWGRKESDTTEWLNCFIPYSKAKFAYYPRCFLTSYFCIPVPYNEKDIFFGC